MARGRTITTFGQMFTPLAVSNGVQFVPVPVPIPEVVLGGGVIVFPGIDRRRYIRWEQEVFQFWVRYFEDVLGMAEAQARLRAHEVVSAADQMPDEDPKEFWLRYFRRVRQLEAQRLMLEMDDEAIIALSS